MKIPGYRIDRRIGQGGMASVYLAVQESLDRPVALKVLNAVLTDDATYSRRFIEEGRIIAALNHANIITIHDVGVADGIHYISMEYVEGGDLKSKMADQMPLDAAIELIRTIGGALDFAHRAGVVHRDVKPANILFRGDGTPLLTDFGIAKRVGGDLTVGTTVLGTPGYLSPEQAQGKTVDCRCDVYSLGVILYELLVGERPFEAETEIATILKQLQGSVPDLPPALKQLAPLLNRMIATRPEGRFRDMPTMLAFIDGLHLPNATHSVRRSNRRVLTLGLGAALGLGVLGLGVLLDSQDIDTGGSSAAVVAPSDLTAPPDKTTTKQSIEATAPDYAQLIEQHIEANDYAAAKEHLTLGLQIQPESARLRELSMVLQAHFTRVEELLASGDEALEDDRLTTPPEDNALHYYNAVLALEPGHPKATEGKARIAKRYVILAEDRIAKYKYHDARELIRRGLQVEPGSQRLLALREKAKFKSAPSQLIRDIKGIFD